MGSNVEPSMDRAGWLAPLAGPVGPAAFAELAMEGAVLALAVWVGLTARDPGAVVFVALVVATRQHAVRGLLHDAVHAGLVAGRSASDAWADLLLAGPLGMSTDGYRRAHLAGHRRQARDAALAAAALAARGAPRPGVATLLRGLACDLLGITTLLRLARSLGYRLGGGGRPVPWRALAGALVVVAALAATGGSAAIAAWVLPAATLLPALVRLRRWVGARPVGVAGVAWDVVFPRAMPDEGLHTAWPGVRRDGLPRLARLAQARSAA